MERFFRHIGGDNVSVTAEELEIVIKANVTDAIKKLEGLKVQIQKTMAKTVEPMQRVNTQVAKTMGATMNQTSKAMSTTASKMDIVNREIELQTKKVAKLRQEMKKYNDAQKKMSAKAPVSVKGKYDSKAIESYIGNTASLGKNVKLPKDVTEQLKKAEIRLDKLKLSAQKTAEQMNKNLTPALKKVSKATKETNKNAISATKIFKRMTLSMLIGRVIRTAINEAIKGFQDLARYSTSFNEAMSKMQSQLITTRNSISVAFEPALKALVPVIEWLSDAVINLFNTLSKLGTMLLGTGKTYNIAKKVVSNYAESLDGASKAQEGMLAGFDELNVISEQQKNGTSGMPSTEEMFETKEITDKDYTPFVRSLLELRDAYIELYNAVKPVVPVLFEGLKWALENVFIPLQKLQLKAVTEMIKTLTKVIQGFKDIFEGEIKLTDFIDNLSALDVALLAITGTIIALTSPIGAVVVAISTLAYAITWLAENWEIGWDLIKKVLDRTLIGKIILEIGEQLVYMATHWDEVKQASINTLESIKRGWSTFKDWIKEYITTPITKLFSTIWEGLKGLFKGFINWIITRINKTIVNTITTINQVILKINKMIRTINEVSAEMGGPTFNSLEILGLPTLLPLLAKGGVLTEATPVIAGEYPGAKTNPEIVAPQSLMYETNVKANIPVINAVEEMGDRIVGALGNIGVYAEFGYDKLKVGLDAESKRTGKKLYSM